MFHDPAEVRYIAANVATLTRMGNRAQSLEVMPRPIYPAYFSDQASDVSPQLSAAVYAALQKASPLGRGATCPLATPPACPLRPACAPVVLKLLPLPACCC